jgi:hypothetical protein
MNMSSSISLTRTAPIIILIVAGMLVGSPYAMASSQQQLTQQEQEQQNRMLSVQTLTTQYLDNGDKQVNGIIFTPRWGSVVFVEPESVSVIFANCLPGEFAVSSQQILAGSDLNVLESYGLAMPNDFMVWLMVVENLNQTDRLPASAGVMCASDRDVDETNPASTIILNPQYKQTVNNIINQVIKIENKQIVNLQQITNIYQQINQNAIQIAIGGGNVTQIINQSASQIVASNGTNINQIINQTASQTAAGGGGANGTSLNQTIGQGANQTAGATTNGTSVNQTINQGANQTAALVTPPADTTAPVLTVPQDIVVEATSEDGAVVTYTVTAQDNVDGMATLEDDGSSVTQDSIGGDITISCDPASSSTFSIDDTSVECSATDAAGNTGTESFTVTVNSPSEDATSTTDEGATSPSNDTDTDT